MAKKVSAAFVRSNTTCDDALREAHFRLGNLVSFDVAYE